MSDVQINSSPPGSTDTGGGVAAGVILGVIVAILLIVALVWYFGTPRSTSPTTVAPSQSGPTININNPPSQSAQPTAGSNTGTGQTTGTTSATPVGTPKP